MDSHMSRSLRLACGTLASQEIRRRRPKSKIDVSAVRRRMKPQDTRSAGSLRHKMVEAELQVEVWGPFLIAALMAARDQGFPTAAGNPDVARNWRSG